MTRKDYEMIAECFKAAVGTLTPDSMGGFQRIDALCVAAEKFCEKAKEDNPRFNEKLFMKACGLDF